MADMSHIISVITDETFLTLESNCYYRWTFSFITLGSKIMLLQMGPLLCLGPNAITDGTFMTLGSKCYFRWDLYYTWVQLLHLCLLEPTVPIVNSVDLQYNVFSREAV